MQRRRILLPEVPASTASLLGAPRLPPHQISIRASVTVWKAFPPTITPCSPISAQARSRNRRLDQEPFLHCLAAGGFPGGRCRYPGVAKQLGRGHREVHPATRRSLPDV